MIKANYMAYGGKRQANFTITNGNKELSLCVDNGMGSTAGFRCDDLTRADIRCFSGGKDVTGRVFGVFDDDVIRGDAENMAQAMNWLVLSSDPYGGQF